MSHPDYTCVVHDPASLLGGMVVVYIIGLITLPLIKRVIKYLGILITLLIKGNIDRVFESKIRQVDVITQPQIIIKNMNVQDGVVMEDDER